MPIIKSRTDTDAVIYSDGYRAYDIFVPHPKLGGTNEYQKLNFREYMCSVEPKDT